MPDVSLRRGAWTVEYVDDVRSAALAYGEEDDGEQDGRCIPRHRLILIDSEIIGITLLETEIHELVHGREGEWDEPRVASFSRDLARALWKLGWRCAPRRARG